MASNRKPGELLPTASADRAAGVRLRKIEETRIIHSSGRSTYPNEKSVLRSGATPVRLFRKNLAAVLRLPRVDTTAFNFTHEALGHRFTPDVAPRSAGLGPGHS